MPPNSDLASLSRAKKSKKCLAKLADILFASFFVCPLVSVFWVSTWDIVYVYIYPDNIIINSLITLAFANTILFVWHLTYEWHTRFNAKLRKLAIEKNSVFGFAAVAHQVIFSYLISELLFVCNQQNYFSIIRNLIMKVLRMRLMREPIGT